MGNAGSSSSISRCKRGLPPAHYTMRIRSYSTLIEPMLTGPAVKLDSGLFESGGHKWKLCLYPKGKGRSENHYVSLYLSIEETGTYPDGWEVFADFKLFVYDQLRDNYLTIHDPSATSNCFSEMKKERGFSELISLETFNYCCNGYLVDDCCVFGAEVCVINRTFKLESLSIVKENEPVSKPVFIVKEPVSKRVCIINGTSELESPSIVKELVSMVKEPVSKPVSVVKESVSKSVSVVKEPVSKPVCIINRTSELESPSIVKELVPMVKEPVSKPASVVKEPVSKPVSVVKEPVSVVKEPISIVNVNDIFTWKIEKFSTLHNYVYESNVFRYRERNWILKVYPKGDSGDGLWLSIFLHLVGDWKSTVPTLANFKIQVLDIFWNIKKDESSGEFKFRAGGLGRGFSKFMELKDLNEFIVNDSLTIQAQIITRYTPRDAYIQAITAVGLTAVILRRRLVDALIVVGDWVAFNDWSWEGFLSGMEKFAQRMEQFGRASKQFGMAMQEIAEGVEMLKDCANPELKGCRKRLPECNCLCLESKACGKCCRKGVAGCNCLCLESKACGKCCRKGVAGCNCSRSQSKCCGKEKGCRIHVTVDV